MATAPTIANIRAWSKLDFARFGYPDDGGGVGDQGLQVQLDRAESYLTYLTSRTYPQTQTDQFPGVKTLMDQAVQMRTEQVIMALASDQLETAADFDMIASFGAGSYNETRRSDTKGQGVIKPLNPWPALNDLLWMLLGLYPGETNDGVLEKHDYWMYLIMGIQTPAWEAIEVNWGRGMGLQSGYWGRSLYGAAPQLEPFIGMDARFG